MRFYLYSKRLLDCLVATVALVLLLPLLLWLAYKIKRHLGAPVLFKQTRIGKDNVPFTLIKFRTMRDSHDVSGKPLPDAQRLTNFGAWLRATSLDELPELWNILRGDMSLIGPRPLLPEYLPYYTEKEALRHTVRPGITGLAQVSGRNALTWDARLLLDVAYVEKMSWRMDLHIALKTLRTVIRKEGISADGMATMSRFDDERKKRIQHGTA